MSLLLAVQGGANYTLTCQGGEYTATGQQATLLRSKRISAVGGSYALSGQAATLLKSKRVIAEGGAYSVAGQAATITFTGLAAAYTLTAQGGEYSISGGAAEITVGVPAPVVGRRFKHYGKAYLKRDNEVLVFQSEAEKEAFLDAEEKAKTAINRAAKRKVIATKPKPIETVSIDLVERQVVEWRMPYNIENLVTAMDLERIIEIQRKIEILQDEEDIELLLL